MSAAELIDEALVIAQRLTPGREFGGRLLQRLEASQRALAHVAERDAAIVAELKLRDIDPDGWFQRMQQCGTLLARAPRQ